MSDTKSQAILQAQKAFQDRIHTTPAEEQLKKYVNITPPPREIQLQNVIWDALEKKQYKF
tara:strand:- start:167 stop:346 length:180 start_codon:yes stop_codon:yes gene_type:complete